MSGARHDEIALPRAVLIGAGLLLLLVTLAAATSRLTGVGATRVADSPAVAVRHLLFADATNGSLLISDAKSGTLVAEVVAGEGNFIRGTMRGLARERKRNGIGIEPAFVLSGRADGRLTLEDPATGRRVDLEVFGPTNAAEFVRLMAPAPAMRVSRLHAATATATD